ncbi:hypothetical protein CK203_013338 [Vitis vinifera]|uniref:Reverse transcriptase zinc-binding domain-containing protein n=1 Tax=Vitis vinifera TaxID=29760 RepID=A0A438JQB4_VITVI|nr:hypothetical protein CK203_013338 [Vitis vinifera]
MWLKEEGFKELLRGWWFNYSGSYSFILIEKLKALKIKLKNWNKEVFGKVGVNMRVALDKVSFWDDQERQRVLNESRIQRDVVRAYQNLLSDLGGWHPSMNSLEFDRIGEEEVARMEEMFSVEEVFLALLELNGDKALGPDVPKKGEADDLCDYRPISLVGGLYKLLTKVLANSHFWLSINLNKSELLPVGRVENVEVLAFELGCKVGSLPSTYLGSLWVLLISPVAVWDGVEERMRKRLALWKRQFISKGGESLSFGARWALLCKWSWRFAVERESFWKLIISRKFGEEGGGWNSREGEILEGHLVRNLSLCEAFPSLFALAISQDAWVADCGGGGEAPLDPSRKRLVAGLEDRVLWKASKNGIFSIKSLYNTLDSSCAVPFLWSIIWSPCVPTKETINHILVHCSEARVLWDLVFSLFGVNWVLPLMVRDTLMGWSASFVDKKRGRLGGQLLFVYFGRGWHSRGLSSDSDGDYHDQVEEVDRSIQRREELQKEVDLMLVCHGCTLNSTSQPRKLPETCHGSCACYSHDFLMISQMEERLEEKQQLVLDLQKKSLKLEGALTAAKKLSSQRQLQLTKLHRCFSASKENTERLKSCEQELQTVLGAAMMEIDIVDDVGLRDGILEKGRT